MNKQDKKLKLKLKLKQQDKVYKWHPYPFNHTKKQLREMLMAYSIEQYSNMLDMGIIPYAAQVSDVILYLRKKNIIDDKEVNTLIKMDRSELIDDKVMAFAIVKAHYTKRKYSYDSYT